MYGLQVDLALPLQHAVGEPRLHELESAAESGRTPPRLPAHREPDGVERLLLVGLHLRAPLGVRPGGQDAAQEGDREGDDDTAAS